MIGRALVSSDWSAQDSLGTELRVISIGEGILAGLGYFVFGAVSLHSLQAGHRVVSLTLSLLTLVTRNVPSNSVFIRVRTYFFPSVCLSTLFFFSIL